jgi:hypothetical protein
LWTPKKLKGPPLSSCWHVTYNKEEKEKVNQLIRHLHLSTGDGVFDIPASLNFIWKKN